MTDAFDRLQTALVSVRQKTERQAGIAIVLGSGLGGLADQLEDPVRIPYTEIDGFPHSAAPGHVGEMLHGDLHGTPVWLMHGRFHLYEGWRAADLALGPRLLNALGAERLLITNAAGALNPEFQVGDVMIIEDHVNLTGQNPLIGPDDERLGLRFPDMSQAYARGLVELATAVLAKTGAIPRRGIYLGVSGPSLETSAERRYYRQCGADAIGMSTVLEVVAAVHCGMEVLGLSAITNMATGGADQQPDTIEEVMVHAARAGSAISAMLPDLLSGMAARS